MLAFLPRKSLMSMMKPWKQATHSRYSSSKKTSKPLLRAYQEDQGQADRWRLPEELALATRYEVCPSA
jgi:hypothetical protein